MSTSYSDLLRLNQARSREETRFLFFHGRLQAFNDVIGSWGGAGEASYHDLGEQSASISPYYPFLTAMRDSYPGVEDRQGFWANVDMLAFQEPVLRSFLESRPCLREDIPFMGELRYERQCLQDSVRAALETLSLSRPFFMILRNAQYLSPESVELLGSLMKRKAAKGLFLLHFDWDKLSPEERDKSYLDDMRAEIWVNHGFLDLPDTDSGAAQGSSRPFARGPSEEKLLAAMAQCRFFHTMHQGIQAAKILADRAPADPVILASTHFFWAWFLHHREPLKSMESSFSYEEARSHYLESLDLDAQGPWAAECLINLAEMAIERVELAAAKEYCLRAASIAAAAGKRVIEARALIFSHITSLRGGMDDSWQAYERAIDILSSEGATANLILGLLSCSPVSRFLQYREIVPARLDRALELAKEARHLVFQSTAYHLKGVLVSLVQGEDAALPFFEEGLRIRASFGETLPLIMIQNGIAYSFLNKGDLLRAFQYMQRSVRLLEGVRDFYEIGMTLFNLATLYFQGRQFDQALSILHRILQTIHILGMRELAFHTSADISLFRAYCSLKKGDILLAAGFAEELAKDAQRISPINRPVYALFQRLLEEGKNGGTCDPGELDWENLSRDRAVRERVQPFYLLELGLHYQRLGRKEESLHAFKEGELLADETGNIVYRTWFERCMETGKEPRPFVFPPLEVRLDPLTALARQEQNLRHFHAKMRDIQFINRCMDGMAHCFTLEELRDSMLRNLGQHYPGMTCVLLLPEDDLPRLVAFPPDSVSMTAPELMELFRGEGQALLYPRSSWRGPASLSHFESLILHPLSNGSQNYGGVLIASAPSRPFREADRELLGILLANFGLKHLSLRQHRELEELARHDSLSRLANRKGLYHRLSFEQSRISRRPADSPPPRFSVCFIDLDDFKRYNDSYGHQAGDYLIARVGQIILSIFRQTDFPARYGGDEFVVLLPDSSADETEKACVRLISELDKQGGFERELSELTGQKIQIENEKRLSCSIGIADLESLTPEKEAKLEELIQLADQALYRAKGAGKGKIVRA